MLKDPHPLSHPPKQKHCKIDTNHFSPNDFLPLKKNKTTNNNAAPHLAIPTWSCAQRAWLVPSVLWSLQIWDQTLHRRPRDLESYVQRRQPCEFEATSGGRDGWRWLTTLPETNQQVCTWKWSVGIRSFPLGMALFSGATLVQGV